MFITIQIEIEHNESIRTVDQYGHYFADCRETIWYVRNHRLNNGHMTWPIFHLPRDRCEQKTKMFKKFQKLFNFITIIIWKRHGKSI